MRTHGTIRAVCVSAARGTPKTPVPSAVLRVGWGIEGDAHGGDWHRQVSLLSAARADEFGAPPGAFGENLTVDGIELATLPVGMVLAVGGAVLEVTQIGKECHSRCAIYDRVGDCIMPRAGVFAKVLRGGRIAPGDRIAAQPPAAPHAPAPQESPHARAHAPQPTAARAQPGPSHDHVPPQPTAPRLRAVVLTASDRGASGERAEDVSGDRAEAILRAAGYEIVVRILLPDDRAELEAALIRCADALDAALVITTGGTGFSPRDVTPEATLAAAHRLAPGIAEAIRAHAMAITPRAMLSRGVAAIRGRTLMVNLPGSPKAVEESLSYILPALEHGLEILQGEKGDCAR